MSIVLSPWVIGAQIKAAAVNLIISAVQELQSTVAALQLAQAGMQLSQGPAYAVPNNAWTVLPVDVAPDYSAGVGLTGTATGVRIGTTARYQISVAQTWAANTTGLRGIGVGAAAGASPTLTALQTAVAGFGTTGSLSQEMPFNAGDVVAVWGFQNSGAPLNCVNRLITVRQMPD